MQKRLTEAVVEKLKADPNRSVEILDGGLGDDTLEGGAGADQFVFTDDWGNDEALDFDDGVDILDLSNTGVLGFTDLTITQSGSHTLISEDGGNSILLEYFTATDITESDFLFV